MFAGAYYMKTAYKTTLTYLLIVLTGTLLHSGSGGAQEVSTFSGVVSMDGHGVEDAQVMALSPRDSTVLAYTFTDRSGMYSLRVSTTSSEILFTVFGMEIKRLFRQVSNKTQTLDFQVDGQVYKLREIQVRPTKIWGVRDTLSYSVTAFEKRGDVVIADVLSRMPGITVDPGGLVKYQGRPINKLYIEGSDALLGRYGLATKNISAEDVREVQVLEHHQPIKALQELVPSDEAALNLLLRDKAKGTLLANAETKGGLISPKSPAYSGALTSMYFSRPQQHILSLKTNNSGHDILSELRSFTAVSRLPELQVTDLVSPEPPPLRRERYLHNRTEALGATNLWKLGESSELNLNIIYAHNRDDRVGRARTIYYLPSGVTQVVDEELHTRSLAHHLEGELRYNRNTSSDYLDNLTELRAYWMSGTGEASLPTVVTQDLRDESIALQNTTHFISRDRGGPGYELYWQSAVTTHPQRLDVTPGLSSVSDLPDDGLTARSLTQEARQRAIYSSLRLSMLTMLNDKTGRFGLSPSLLADVLYQQLDSRLIGSEAFIRSENEGLNDLDLTKLSLGVSVNAWLKWRRSRLDFFLPIYYRYSDLRSESEKVLSHRGHLSPEPHLSLKYAPIPDLFLTLFGDYSTNTPGMADMYGGYILRNYRSIERHEPSDYDFRLYGVGLKADYKDIFNMFFGSGEVYYSHYKSDVINSLHMDGPFGVVRRIHMPNSGDRLSFSGEISKSFFSHGINLSLRGSSILSRGVLLRQEQPMDFLTRQAGLETKADAKWLGGKLLSSYEMRWGVGQMRSGYSDWSAPLHSLSQQLALTLAPTKALSVRGVMEHYYVRRNHQDRSFVLADVGVTYGGERVTVTLDWTNILNTLSYSDSSLSEMIDYSHTYMIRPMTVMLGLRFKLL